MRTPAEARAWLDRYGVTITEWARQHGFKPGVVSSLLAGRTRGRWGEAHEAAIMLGLRPAPYADEEHPLASPRRSSESRGVASDEEIHMT